MKRCPDNCYGRGTCLVDGTCKCKPGFSGEDCKEFKCKNACSGRGVCDASKQECVCYEGYSGGDCSKKPCPNSCKGQGTCDHKTGKCKCNIGLYGADCSKRKCPAKCEEHGKCDSITATCLCKEGWEGPDCTKKILPCARKCPANGKCDLRTKRCACNKGWTGRHCNTRSCPDNCSGHGSCDEISGKCTCLHGYGGPTCRAVSKEDAWGYEGSRIAPREWSSISADFKSCANGRFQSPVSLPWDGKEGGMDAFYHNISFGYTTIPAYSVVDNGHFYAAHMVDTYGNQPHYFHAGDHKYQLKNVTIHTPAEHSFGSTHYDMELQLNHEDDFGNLASVSILFTAVDQVQGNFYQQFSRGDFWRGASRGNSAGAYMSLGPYLPKGKHEMHFYSYQGSQTHPPCYEGVQWFIMSKTHQILKPDVEHLLRTFGSNARPIQPKGPRTIGFY